MAYDSGLLARIEFRDTKTSMFDWQKNSAIAGAVTGVAVALASDDSSHERIVQSAITGAAVSAAANIFAGIF